MCISVCERERVVYVASCLRSEWPYILLHVSVCLCVHVLCVCAYVYAHARAYESVHVCDHT